MKSLTTVVPFLLLALTTKAIPLPDPQTIILVGADLTVRDPADPAPPAMVERTAREKSMFDDVKSEDMGTEPESAASTYMPTEEAASEEHEEMEQLDESNPEAATAVPEDVSEIDGVTTTVGGEEEMEEAKEEEIAEKNEELVEENQETTEMSEEMEERNEEVDGRIREEEEEKMEEEKEKEELVKEEVERVEEVNKEMEQINNEEEEEKNEELKEKNEEEQEKNEEENEKSVDEQDSKVVEEQDKKQEEQDKKQEEEEKVQEYPEGKDLGEDGGYEEGHTPLIDYDRVPQGPIGGPAPWPWAFQLGPHDGGLDGVPQRGLIDQVGNEVWSPRSAVVPIYVIRFDPRYLHAPHPYPVA